MSDKIIICQDCRQEFVWTAGEQSFFKEKKLGGPVRCPVCRGIYKAASADRFRGKAVKA